MNRILAKIEDNPFLVRDMYSKAVLSTDISIVRQHEKRMIDMEKEEARSIEINNIKSDISEIKNLLKTLLQR